jgi:hypothetical protein
LHRFGAKLASDDAPGLVPLDQPCISEHIEMLHDRR